MALNLAKTSMLHLSDLGDTAELHCPRCDSSNLHSMGVTLYERSEDDDTVVKIDTGGATVSTKIVEADASGNPSLRRHGLAVKFDCEICSSRRSDYVIELTIAQHKGLTLVGWRFTPLGPDEISS